MHTDKVQVQQVCGKGMKPTKQYQLWTLSDGNSYTFEEFDTLEEALNADRYTSHFIITKKVDYEVIDLEAQNGKDKTKQS